MNIAIIAAAGQGKRMDGRRAKQFLELAGTPILIHTLNRFDQCEDINESVVVATAADVSNCEKLVASYCSGKPVRVIAGGATRSESVWLGLQVVDPSTADIIAVHDGVRPFVMPAEISRTIEMASIHGAAILVAPVTDTIKQIVNGGIERTLDRSRLRRALTPQCFRYDILRRAYENGEKTSAATDCSMLVEAMGIEVFTVDGDARNIKITRPEDLAYGEVLIKQNSEFRTQNLGGKP